MRITMLRGSNKFYINDKVQPKTLLAVFSTYCHSWAHGWEAFSDSVCFILKDFDEKGRWGSYSLLCLAFERRERATLVSGTLLPPPVCPCFSSRGAGSAQEESEDLGRVLALPLTPSVALGKLPNISGSQFQYRVVVRIKKYDQQKCAL